MYVVPEKPVIVLDDNRIKLNRTEFAFYSTIKRKDYYDVFTFINQSSSKNLINNEYNRNNYKLLISLDNEREFGVESISLEEYSSDDDTLTFITRVNIQHSTSNQYAIRSFDMCHLISIYDKNNTIIEISMSDGIIKFI